MFVYLPFAIALLVLFVIALTPTSRRADRVVNRVAWAAFRGRHIATDAHRERHLRAAGIGTPYRLYQAKTHLYTAAGAFCGAILGIYAGAFVVDALDVRAISSPIGADIFRPLPPWLLTFSAKTSRCSWWPASRSAASQRPSRSRSGGDCRPSARRRADDRSTPACPG